ncbi:unnamed protein product [Calicophoron daubneyi]|uniref:Protein kinase domain-containing protein n=1 Tax=Calicophoron daubneyi TaxID=300641 RepID=A0AAV2T4Q9_CALDB
MYSDTYLDGQVIGRGVSGTVKLCVHRATGVKYAVKQVRFDHMTSAGLRQLEREISICKKLNHPNIVHFYDFFREERICYLVFELISGGELFDYLVNTTVYSETTASKHMYHVLDAVSYLHTLNIIHRDLKPENLLLSGRSPQSEIKLIDFGSALQIKRDLPARFGVAGSYPYMAPEVARNEAYGKPVDVWSCGVVLYILLSGFAPFWNDDREKLIQQVRNGVVAYPPNIWDSVSPNARSLVERMLVVNPFRRITAADALKDPWISLREVHVPTTHRPQTQYNLQLFNARRKLKTVMLVAQAAMNFADLDDIFELNDLKYAIAECSK